MAKLDSVLRHSITSPTFDQTKLNRHRLVDAIHANIPRKLIVIAAPAGYGKTTLLTDFNAHTELPICWVRLTEADCDAMRLATVLAASLQKRFRRLSGMFDLERLASSSPEALARTFVDVIDTQISKAFVIALDDVHLINRSSAAMSFIDTFLEAQPENVTMIASGREVIEVSLARLMAEGDLAGFGPQDLALTRPELVALAQMQAGIELEEEEADRLLEETRGWITGVVLSGKLSTTGLSTLVQDPRPMVYEYLASVVLNRQPDDLRRFMINSSVFPVMTADGCDYLLQQDSSHRLLRRLVRGGMFVTTTDENPRTYEYHPQFRHFLLELLGSADRKLYKKLMMRAAGFLAEHGSSEYAVDLYFNAGAKRKAAMLAEKRAEEMYRNGRLMTLEVWSRRLAASQVPTPRIFLCLTAYYAMQGNLDAAETSLKQGREMLKPGADKEGHAYAEILHGHIAAQREKYDEVLEAAEEAESILARRGSRLRKADCYKLRALASLRQGNLHLAESFAHKAIKFLDQPKHKNALASALFDLSIIQSALGKAVESHATTLRAHEILVQVGAPMLLAVSFNNLAYDAHLQGNYEEALDLYNEALKYARRAASPAREALYLFNQADLFCDLDLALQAAELYGQGLTLAARLDDVRLTRYGCIQTSVLHRRRGGSALAHEWLGRAIDLEEGGDLPASIIIQLGILEASAKPQQARDNLAKLVKNSETLTAGERTLALFFQARAALTAGDMEEAQEILEKALDWCGGNGTEQMLAGELAFDENFREFARLMLSHHPVLSVVLRRIDTMRAVAQHYQEIPEDLGAAVHLAFIALGDASVQSKDRGLSELKPLAREVLFYLVDHQRVERDILQEIFWPHHPPGRQVANLHTAVYTLRREIGRDVILHEGPVYCINPDLPVEYDVLRFERAASIAEGLPPGDPRKMFALTEAINSYGGKFLPEFASEWVLERRRDLEIRYLDLLAHHAQEALVRDQPLRAISTLQQALQIDPYRDDTNLSFLEALGRLGRRSEVVAHYQHYIRMLADELGLDPPETVRELYARLIE